MGDRLTRIHPPQNVVEADDVFTHDNLHFVRELTERFETLEGVRDVNSLTNILDMKKTGDGLEVGKLLPQDRIPSDLDELKQLRDYTLSKEMYTEGLISPDGQHTVIVCRLEEGTNKQEVATELQSIGDELRDGRMLYYGGMPMSIPSGIPGGWVIMVGSSVIRDFAPVP